MVARSHGEGRGGTRELRLRELRLHHFRFDGTREVSHCLEIRTRTVKIAMPGLIVRKVNDRPAEARRA